MEKIISDEEKLRKAIEISQRRNKNNYYKMQTEKVNVNKKKDYRLFKKTILQIIICLLIYLIFYLITTTNYVFSDSVLKSTNEILNYDINFLEIYNNLIKFIETKSNAHELVEKNNNVIEEKNIIENNGIFQNNEQLLGNNIVAGENKQITINNNESEDKIENQKESMNQDETSNTEKVSQTNQNEDKEVKTQMELDAEEVKKICKFTKPLSGTITSKFGEREIIMNGMTSEHKGIDIAANKGTNIKAAMAGTVSVAEENSEYGKFIKIVAGDVMTVYAHCNKLKVKKGEKVKMRTNNSNSRFDRGFYWPPFTF